MAYDPVVFISSTGLDLKEHREQAASAARAMGFSPRMMEYFPAQGHQPSLPACLEMVAQAEVIVVLVAHRYGWVPENSSNPGRKSITWLECEHAWIATNKEVLAFLVDPEHPWPLDHRENYRLVTESDKRGIRGDVKRNEKLLAQFKSLLGSKFRGKFTDPPSVRHLVSEALAAWKERHPSVQITSPGDPEAYLQALEDDTRQIRLQNFEIKRAEPYVFSIDEIYIRLSTLARGDREKPGETHERVALEQAITNRQVVIIGEPGAGKSTFLRRMAFELCRSLRATRPPNAPPFLKDDDRRFPIHIRIADLAKTLQEPTSRPDDSPDWIPYSLGRRAGENNWRLDEAFFRKRLEDGGCLVMLDGLDEAPGDEMRHRISRLLERSTKTFNRCDFLVTTRPDSYVGDTVLAGFHPLRIGDLEASDIEFFLGRFALALALPQSEAAPFQQDLRVAIETRLDVREMARNPVMLTALAILRHNGQKLPEHRLELYTSILKWLLLARSGLPEDDFRRLALKMQEYPGGRVVQINRREAAEFLAPNPAEVEATERKLERETVERGILASAGRDIKFWHLSFQEYFAARKLAEGLDTQQHERIVKSGALYQPGWREVMRLYAAVLFDQGTAKVTGLFQAILGELGDSPSLVRQAPCAALLGTMMRDLGPMGFRSPPAEYERVLKSVMRIFEADAAQDLDLTTRIEIADAIGQAGDPRVEEDNWITILRGSFWIGAQKDDPKGRNYDPEAFDDESPVRLVTLEPFRIRRFPVTVAEFEQFVVKDGYRTRKYWNAGGWADFDSPEDWEEQKQYPNRPVVSVSWFEACAYCAWAGCRLPTETEWERAARGPKGSRYPWGDEKPSPDCANYSEGGPGHPTPVGLYPLGATPEGVLDLAGNVWEWCANWYDTSQDRKALRGGSWSNLSRYLRVSYRFRYEPTIRDFNFGFRCLGGSDSL